MAHCDLDYAELEVTSNFSFLRRASHPDELVYSAADLGYRAIAITITTRWPASCGPCGRQELGMKLLIGSAPSP